MGLPVAIFISDRHRSIAKWIRECRKDTTHYYDIWHVAKSITKKLVKACKEKGCEIISYWIQGIKKHLYWCATSTKAGFEALILAKWMSFLRHVANKHSDHPNALYKECNHGQLERRKWIKIGTNLPNAIVVCKIIITWSIYSATTGYGILPSPFFIPF